MRFAPWCAGAAASCWSAACGSESSPSGAVGGAAGTAGSAGRDAGVPEAAPPGDMDAAPEADGPSTAWPPAEPATALPLEVLGAPGAGVEVSLLVEAAHLDTARARGSAHLALTVHNVVAPESAMVAINGAAPIDLGDPQGPFLRRFDGQVASGRVALDP